MKLPFIDFIKAGLSKPFSDAVYGDRNKGILYLFIGYALLITMTFFVAIFSIPLAYIHQQNFALSSLTSDPMLNYFQQLYYSFGLYVFIAYYDWIIALFTKSDISWIPFAPLLFYKITYLYFDSSQPYDLFPIFMSRGEQAKEHHIKKMGLFDGFIIVLGKFKTESGEKKLLKLKETLSVLACAPPGTGKTVGIVVPTIFECDNVSMIVNDPKPELCYKTSGYRATKGPVFIINWGASDEPDKGIYYPRWNPLSPDLIPPMGPERDMYIDTISNVLIQDAKGSSSDPHWSSAGRNALTGMLHFMASKCEKAAANDYFYYKLRKNTFTKEDAELLAGYYMVMDDPYAKGALRLLQMGQLNINNFVPVGTWENIPDNWKGKEASIPMILDWLTEAQINAAEAVNKRKQQGDQMAAFNTDIVHDVMENSVKEARKYSYAHRCILELNQLANTPEKERGSILSNVLTNTSIFKNSAVRERTCASDISFKDLRGMLDPTDGKMKPVTVYLSVNQSDAKALSVISGVFIELMSKYLIANPPEFEGRSGKNGPFPVLFVLDEFPQMPKLEAVIDGPAVGRGQKVSYLLIGQDLGQIEAGYGKDAVEILMSTTAAKIILTQNNDKTAERFANMISKKTAMDYAVKSDSPDKVFAFDVKKSIKSDDIFSKNSILNLSAEKQIVLVQGFYKFPIEAESPRYFKDPKMLKKSEIPPSPAVPEWIRLKTGY